MAKRKKTTIISDGNGSTVEVRGEVSGFVVGDGADVTMNFNGDDEPQIVVRRGQRVDVSKTETQSQEETQPKPKRRGWFW